MTHVYRYISDPYVLGLISLVIPVLISLRLFPIIIYTVRVKNLMDVPGDRSTHGDKTPTLGGVGLFISFAITLICFGMVVGLSQGEMVKLLALLAGTMILLFLGVKDDLIELAPKKKFIGQVIAAAIVVLVADVRITNFLGLFDVGELPYFVSALFSIFLFLVFINAYNLIDGIDGLAGSVGIVASVFFGIYFLLNGDLLMLMISFALIGSLSGFLRFNLSDTNKLFMGDSGSMFTGFLLTFQAIALIEYGGTAQYILPNAPVLAVAILSYPALDTFRVFVLRLSKGRSPFHGDNNHIHHRLLDKGLSHKQSTVLIAFSNLLIISFTYFMGDMDLNWQLFVLLFLVPTIYMTPLLRRRRKRQTQLRVIYPIGASVKIRGQRKIPITRNKEDNTGSSFKRTDKGVSMVNQSSGYKEKEDRSADTLDMHKVLARRLEELEKAKRSEKKTNY